MGLISKLSGATLALGLLAGAASAETTWTMATGYPETNFFTKNVRMFIDEVQTATDGALKIDLRPNDELIKLDAVKRAVQSGQVAIGEIRLGIYGNEDPMYLLDSVPALAGDYDHAAKLMAAQKPYLDKIFDEKGMKLLGFTPWPGQGFYTKFPVTDGSEFQDVKIRIYSKSTQDMAQKLGFQATILPFAEVPQAFSTGLIDALFTSAQTGVDIQAWDYAQYFTYAGSIFSKNAIVVNKKAFDKLDPAVQEALVAAGEAATVRGYEMSAAANEETIATLKEHGMTITEASPELMAKLDAIGAEMAEAWAADADEAQKAVLAAYMAAD
ncbi:TRAP transporter substrate-binding protein [Mangrovicoccus sp. HB161399]|uniref:TRAP transporter substrate-binding protein n=1 Tax=Mangrovicoccus sp. HB161399 TaxID=2720392 RepID=UPI001553DD6B|nr:TRAP transporter substrate-binding protein [Mangrovicoccus sp. HB161399]